MGDRYYRVRPFAGAGCWGCKLFWGSELTNWDGDFSVISKNYLAKRPLEIDNDIGSCLHNQKRRDYDIFGIL